MLATLMSTITATDACNHHWCLQPPLMLATTTDACWCLHPPSLYQWYCVMSFNQVADDIKQLQFMILADPLIKQNTTNWICNFKDDMQMLILCIFIEIHLDISSTVVLNDRLRFYNNMYFWSFSKKNKVATDQYTHKCHSMTRFTNKDFC